MDVIENDQCGTQLLNECTISSPETTKKEGAILDNEEKSKSNIWGVLRRHCPYGSSKLGENVDEEIKLYHRIDDLGIKDTYHIGRKSTNDIIVKDMRVSSNHCKIYCDYSQPKLRVFIEDTSANGTFVNFSLQRLSKGQRMELKSGDEIFLLNPKHNLNSEHEINNSKSSYCTFIFFNMRERMFDNREKEIAVAHVNSTNTVNKPHIEDFYVIADQIGSGTCGQVHRCIHKSTGKNFAVKIIDVKKYSLLPGLSLKDLREEADMMRTLDHPSIIKVEDSFETDQAIFIVMELLLGGDLFDRIIERGKYSETQAKKVIHNILEAVKYLHNKDIIHRDLKPENILLVSNKSDTDIKLSDFGLAKRTNSEGLKTFCGTPFYFAPEVLRRKNTTKGVGRYGASADMWSIGVILYILLSGTFPFEENSLYEQIEYAQFSLSGSEWKDISESAKHFIKSLLTLRPENRMNVQQALNHPWFETSNNISIPNIYSLFKKLNPIIDRQIDKPTIHKKKSIKTNKTKSIEILNPSIITDNTKQSEIINSSVVHNNDKPIKKIFWSNRSIKEVKENETNSNELINTASENLNNNKSNLIEGSLLQTILKTIEPIKHNNKSPKKISSTIKQDSKENNNLSIQINTLSIQEIISSNNILLNSDQKNKISEQKLNSPNKNKIEDQKITSPNNNKMIKQKISTPNQKVSTPKTKFSSPKQINSRSNSSNQMCHFPIDLTYDKANVILSNSEKVKKKNVTPTKKVKRKQKNDVTIVKEGSVVKHIYPSDANSVYKSLSDDEIDSYSSDDCIILPNNLNKKVTNKRKLREPKKTIADMFRKKIKS